MRSSKRAIRNISVRAGWAAATALTALVVFGAGGAAAESVLTMHIEEQTSWVQNFNPFDLAGRRQSTMDFIYEPLVIFNAEDGGKPVFRLATDYKFSEDMKSVTYTLRSGVKWSDGQPLTSADVKYTIDLMLKNAALDTVGVGESVASVETPSPTEVRIDLKAVNSDFPESLADLAVVPEHIWKDVSDPVAFKNEKPVGSGPMTELRRFTPQVYEQCRNPNYWDAASLHVDCLRLPQISGNDQMLAILPEGNMDWIGSFIPQIDKTFVALDADHNGYWQPPAETVAFQMNFKSGNEGNLEAYKDLNFRHAFSLAMDRASMVDIAGFGYPVVNEHATGLPPRFETWRNKGAEGDKDAFMGFDTEKANKILDDAGYKKGADGFRTTPGGKPIAFPIIVPNGWTDWIDAVQIAVEGLRAAGINASVATPEYEQWRKQIIDGSFEVVMNSRADGATPFRGYYQSLSTAYGGRITGAPSRYSNPKLDALFDQYLKATSEDDHKKIFNDIQLLIADDFPVVPVFNGPTWYQFSSKRFTGWVTDKDPVMNPEDHDNNRMRLMHLLRLKPVS
ncbi:MULTISPECIES: ABC transporter substrate-binding protein [Rhizobium]|jgi:peptide/nickel transport system substrate-binding protein|uniref:ABC transporter substrate-binding protein n=1 Tax=Rhizobium TaxID=379 RepID=UPI0007B52480|nr:MULTISPECIES: ABC transporter substrate-binding protein [Rhizobium]KZS51081.1 peptide ABC transporter substrate-binding protein [Rhizobium anhuiense bv. trifolii]MBB3298305.1 peptide/nickel transport system substrate-binding protein [Rhizobium sp. BK112]MBB3367787.1 peptide/nickel transport system substrate-binding protein [Rhizobium sp. BK077]MBB4178197.1 peptide/nickel transport system substrate-binding protein [Rhizobium sp. BK109]PDS59423.1 peptide ABC transporter substrate-binding prot